MQDYLSHHGILGQKWGQKNGPPYPIGTGGTTHSKSEKRAGWRKSLGGGRNEHLYDKTKKISVEDRKEIYSRKKQRDKKNIGKALIIGGVIGAAALGGYALYKTKGYKYINNVVKKGTTLQNLHMDPNRIKKGEIFYASFLTKDKLTYQGFFGQDKDWFSQETKTTKYATIMSAKNNLKIADEYKSRKAFTNLFNNDEHFRNSVCKMLINGGYRPALVYRPEGVLKRVDFANGSQLDVYAKRINASAKKMAKDYENTQKVNKDLYDKFNQLLTVDTNAKAWATQSRMGGSYARKTFYNNLKDKGFQALVDTNDQNHSFAQKPIIVFDKSSVFINSVSKLSEDSPKLARIALRDENRKVSRLVSKVSMASGASVFTGTSLYLSTDEKIKEIKN